VPQALLDEELESLAASVSFFEAAESLTAKAEMSFASGNPRLRPLPRPAQLLACPEPARRGGDSSFTVEKNDQPLNFEPLGMTKGQLYINGRHLGRYLSRTPDGKPVPPQDKYLIPASG